MTITKLDQFTLLAQSYHLDSQASQSIHHTGYNIHAQRKEQKHQKTYPFKGMQKSTIRRRTKTMPPHTTRPLQMYCQIATLAITTPVYSLNRAYILLPFSPASAPNQNLKSPAYAAYLNSLLS